MRLIISVFLVVLMGCDSMPAQEQKDRVKVGAELLIDQHLDELQGQRVGLVMNPTSRIGETHMLDSLLALDVNVTALFAPEHGFRGEAGAGETIEDGVDQATGLPVFSLYGDTRKPTPGMLDNVDILLFDMQDVGARFYTYNVTLGLVLEAAAASSIPVWVLDRPNPAGGEFVAGWILQEDLESFVGAYPIPMAHGMTLGELGQMMIGEQWINYEQKPELRVIPVQNWERSMKWPETGLQWHPPSPNLPTFEHAFAYLGTVLFEGTNISEGRGTEDPFLTIGAPTTALSDSSLEDLRARYPSLSIERTSFTPRSIPGKAPYPKFEGEQCHGIKISINNYDELNSVRFGVDLLETVLAATQDAETNDFIYNLAGSKSVTAFKTDWEAAVADFREHRKSYLIY